MSASFGDSRDLESPDKLQNEPMIIVIHLFCHVLWATEEIQFLHFLPSNSLLPRKTENTLKSGPDSLLVFQQLKIKSALSE